jgi:hypothetical protein
VIRFRRDARDGDNHGVARSLSPARRDQHIQITKLGCRHFIWGRNEPLDEKQLCSFAHRTAAHLKYSDSFIVLPIVDDHPHQIGVTAVGNRFEETFHQRHRIVQ